MVVEKTRYDDFGNFTQQMSIANPYLFQGRRYDPETGLFYYRNRYYDPLTGRFIQRDPVWDPNNRGNQYTFVGNNPMSMRDPMGTIGWIAIPIVWAVQELVTMAAEVAIAQDNANELAAAEARLLENADTAAERALVRVGMHGSEVKALKDTSDLARECGDTLMPALEAGEIRDVVTEVTGD